MSEEQEYSQIFDGLLVGVDMEDAVSRKMAYNACLAYAEQTLDGDPQVNQFLALAADRLGQMRIHLSVLKEMVPMPDGARLHLRYAPQGGPVLTGNTDGLRYLSDLCAALAASLLPDGDGPEEHVHLYDAEPPMFGDTYGLTMYHSADAWFDKHAVAAEDGEEDGEAEEDGPPPPTREITPEQVVAVEFFQDDSNPLPPTLYLRYDKLYRVLDCRPHLPEDEVWAKPPPDGGGRIYVFSVRDDAQEVSEIALDLDDAGVHYFTRSDLEQIWGADTL